MKKILAMLWPFKSQQQHSRRRRWRLELEALETREVLSTLYAVSTVTNHLIKFDSATPGTLAADVAISGLQGGAGERVVGIDFRPRTGQLFAVGATLNGTNDDLRVYVLNPKTGAATEIGTAPVPVVTGAQYGVDFNPVVDRIRVVNSAAVNIRLNPNNGLIAGVDAALNPGAPSVDGSAYDRNFDGTLTTTLYAINRASSTLVTQGGINGSPSPNGGTLLDIGPLGFTPSPTGGIGFDIAASGAAGGTGLAVFTDTATTKTGLYSINLANGAATLVGLVGDGGTGLSGLAITPASRYVIGSGGGTQADVRVFDSFTNQQILAINPFENFKGDVRVALGDVNRDSVPDVIVGASINGHVKVFDGVTGTLLQSFLAFGGFAGGVRVACGDVNNDGFKDVIVSADDAPGGHIKAFSGADNSLLSSFLSFPGFSGRVNVSAADFNLDRADEIVAAVNSNGHVKVFNFDGAIFSSPTFFGSFLAFNGYAGGISVAAGDLNGDGVPDVIVGAQSGQGHVKAFSGKDGSQLASFFAYEAGFTGGVNVAVGDFNKDGRFEIRTAPGKGRTVQVRAFDLIGTVLDTFQPFNLYDGGASIGGERL